MNFTSFFKEVLQHIKFFGWNFMNVLKCMTLSQNPYQLYNFFLCWNVIVVLAFQEFWGFIFREKKVVCLFFSFKIYTVKTAITVWVRIIRKCHVQCIYIMYRYFFSQNNVILSNWRACYCLKKIQTYYVPPFLKDSSPFGALFKNYDVKVVLKFYWYMYNIT